MEEPGSSGFVWEEPVPESGTWVQEPGTGSTTPPPGAGTRATQVESHGPPP